MISRRGFIKALGLLPSVGVIIKPGDLLAELPESVPEAAEIIEQRIIVPNRNIELDGVVFKNVLNVELKDKSFPTVYEFDDGKRFIKMGARDYQIHMKLPYEKDLNLKLVSLIKDLEEFAFVVPNIPTQGQKLTLSGSGYATRYAKSFYREFDTVSFSILVNGELELTYK